MEDTGRIRVTCLFSPENQEGKINDPDLKLFSPTSQKEWGRNIRMERREEKVNNKKEHTHTAGLRIKGGVGWW